MAEETTPNSENAQGSQIGEEGPPNPAAGEAGVPSVSKEHAPTTDEPVATDIPSANTPDPKAVAPEGNPNSAVLSDEGKAEGKATKAAKPAAKKPGAEGEAAPAKAKKEKAPAVEDKPFGEFIEQHYLPALRKALTELGTQDLDLKFEQQKIPIIGFAQEPECWQVIGRWQGGRREFRLYFFKEDISAQRGFSYAESGGRPSTLEPFLIDERKITLDLLVFGVMQRLVAQKWLVRN